MSKYITRTISFTNCRYAAVNLTTMDIETLHACYDGVLSSGACTEIARKECIDGNKYAFVKVLDVEQTTGLYQMTLADFVTHAEFVRPITKEEAITAGGA